MRSEILKRDEDEIEFVQVDAVPVISPSIPATPTSIEVCPADLASHPETYMPLTSYPPSALDWVAYRSLICTLYKNQKLRQVRHY
jgi:hypothetical protein